MLKPYSPSDFKLVESWITDEEILLQCSGTDFSYPLTIAQITAYQVLHPDRRSYIGYTIDGLPFAFGELIPQESGNPRLARILIGKPSQRAIGMGKYFVRLLLEEVQQRYQSTSVDLYVWEKNEAAIRCYESVGFIFSPERAMTMVHKDVSYHIHKMIYTFSKD